MFRAIPVLILFGFITPVLAANLRVPQDHKTIQDAVDAAQTGDTVLVTAGTYKERIQLKQGNTVWGWKG